VPAPWSPGGYAALYVTEMPEVRFEDIQTVKMGTESRVRSTIDPRFIAVCEPGSIVVCGLSHGSADAWIEDGFLHVHSEKNLVSPMISVRLSGVRKGFKGRRFGDRSREQFEANEKFIGSAYPANEGRKS